MDLAVERPMTLLRDQVVAKLRQAIVTGHYRPGQRLLERDLCASLNVSRTSVREALRQLEIEQLVSVGPRGRPYVATMDAAVAAEIYEFRVVLERAAVAMFIARAPDTAFAALDGLGARFTHAIAAGDLAERLEVKSAFYDILFTHAGNPSMQTVFVQLFNRIGFLRARSLGIPDRARTRSDEMAELVARIAARDVPGAQSAIERHVLSVRDLALRHLNEQSTA